MRKIFLNLISCSILASMIVGCDSIDGKNTNSEKISSLENQISQLQTDLSTLNDQISKDNKSYAIFTPGSVGYSIVQSNVGYFVVSLERLTKYANGYRATFNIGNPTLITYNGIRVHVEFGRSYSKDMSFSDWMNSLNSEDLIVNKQILPGVWNNVSVVLSPASPSDTGFISISVSSDQIILSNDYRAG